MGKHYAKRKIQNPCGCVSVRCCVDSRQRLGYTYRRYQCADCAKRWTTVEVPTSVKRGTSGAEVMVRQGSKDALLRVKRFVENLLIEVAEAKVRPEWQKDSAAK